MRYSPEFPIAGVPVGGDRPCFLVAEMSNAHNGSLDRALRLIDAMKAAGADAVKVQAYSVDDLIALRGDGPAPEPWGSQGFTMRSLYEKAQTPLDWIPTLFAHARALGMPIFSSVFGVDGFLVLDGVKNPCYKMAALDFGSNALRDLVMRTDVPVIRSCHDAVAPTRWPLSMTLYAPPGYPQPRAYLANIRNGYDGYSYHGTNPEVPVAAVLAGAKILEVHFQLDDEPSELEANVSLTASQFRRMVDDVRRVEAMLS